MSSKKQSAKSVDQANANEMANPPLEGFAKFIDPESGQPFYVRMSAITYFGNAGPGGMVSTDNSDYCTRETRSEIFCKLWEENNKQEALDVRRRIGMR